MGGVETVENILKSRTLICAN